MLPSAYRETFSAMLQEIHTQHSESRFAERRLTAFAPVWGESYVPGRGFMVIGRAVNEWQSKKNQFAPKDTGSGKRRLDVIYDVVAQEGNNDNLGWSDGYNSAFWRITKNAARVFTSLSALNPETWWHHICWSNLYKIAPGDGGHPHSWLRNPQREYCVRLLRMELDTLRPRYVLVLAGYQWYEPFLGCFGGASMPVDVGAFVEGILRRGEERIVFARHPQGKEEQPFMERVNRSIFT